MSPLLKDKRKIQREKSKEISNGNGNGNGNATGINELKTTLQIGQNVNDLIILNSMFQINPNEKPLTSNSKSEEDKINRGETLDSD